jgi:Spy/CpxP family protein refolding chaperone
MTSVLRSVLVVLALAWAASAGAQPMEHHGFGGPGMGMGPGAPPFLENLFPPGLIMRHQADIGLTAAQRDAITQAMSETEKQLVDLQWQFEGEADKLTKMLDGAKVDETAALAEAEKVMAIEQRIKKTHLTLLLRIKNQLDAAQQDKLRALRPVHAGAPPRE